MKTIRLWVAGCALAGQAGLSAAAQVAQAGVSQPLAQAQAFSFDKLAAKRTANGGESRSIVSGTLATGEAVALHESIQPVGAEPNPAHRIEHTEFIVVIAGTIEFDHDGHAETVGAGSVLFVAPGTLHALRNVGKVPAQYCVIAIGGDVKR